VTRNTCPAALGVEALPNLEGLVKLFASTVYILWRWCNLKCLIERMKANSTTES